MKTLIDNKSTRFEYHLEEFFEAGLVLEGWEVKSLLAGRGSLNEAYVRVLGDEVALIGAHITPTSQYLNCANLDPTRTRKLLLNRSEINKLIGKVQISGFTLVPVRMYYKGRRLKLEIALAKGKKLRDKREDIKKRDIDREIRQSIKTNSRENA